MGGPCICGLILTVTNNFATLTAWKEEHGLKHFFHTPHSPDLSPSENCRRAVKQYISANISITGLILMELVLAGWKRIPQSNINQLVDSMVVRM